MHRPRHRAVAALGVLLACLLLPLTLTGQASAGAAGDGGQVYVSDGSAVQGASAFAQMMAVPSEDTGYVPSIAAPGDDGPAACPPRRCLERRIRVPAGVKVSDSTVRVLLPNGYHKKKNRTKRYPVVYLYNGAVSAPDSYTRFTTLTAMSRHWKAIFVMPEGGHGEYPGMFSDWVDGSFDWETFHIGVVIPWVDHRFRTIPGGRAAAGISMGGMGAMMYAERHPQLFKAVFSMSGVLDTNTLLGNSLPPSLSTQLGLLPPELTRVWGSPVLDRANWSAHNPAENVAALEDMLVLVSSGTGSPKNDPDDPLHSGYLEEVMWTSHRTFLGQLAAQGIPFQARIAQGGVHRYPWFDEPMRWGLPLLVAAARR
jgi:S-formylglutathione hydrolase FrmB